MFVRGFCIAESTVKVAPQVYKTCPSMKGQVFFIAGAHSAEAMRLIARSRSSSAKFVPANQTPREGHATGGDSAKRGLRNMEQQIKREVATQTATAGEASAPRKREVAAALTQGSTSTAGLILIAVLPAGRGVWLTVDRCSRRWA